MEYLILQSIFLYIAEISFVFNAHRISVEIYHSNIGFTYYNLRKLYYFIYIFQHIYASLANHFGRQIKNAISRLIAKTKDEG